MNDLFKQQCTCTVPISEKGICIKCKKQVEEPSTPSGNIEHREFFDKRYHEAFENDGAYADEIED